VTACPAGQALKHVYEDKTTGDWATYTTTADADKKSCETLDATVGNSAY